MTAALSALFIEFAQSECSAEPLYAELARRTAGDAAILSLLDAAPVKQRRPVLLLAAVHYLLLQEPSHQLARYYPSIGGQAPIDDAVFTAFQDFCQQHRTALCTLLASRTTQTNEVGRCAGLLPVLQQIVALRERPLALIDIGASAGLNLGIDRYRYVFPQQTLGDLHSEVVIAPQACGTQAIPVTAAMPPIVERIGIDIDPVDIFDDDRILWLRACIWPYDTARMTRFMAAVATMRAHPVRLERGDAVQLAQQHVKHWARETTVVLFNSWVVTYFDADLHARYTAAMEKLVREHDAFWVAAEAPGVVTRAPLPPLPADADADEEFRTATLWSVCHADDAGSVTYRTVARSHAHGKWIEWIALLDERLQRTATKSDVA